MVKTLLSNTEGAGSIPGKRTKIPHATGPKKPKHKAEVIHNRPNKDFKNDPHKKKNLKKKNGFRSKNIQRIIIQILDILPTI